MLVTPSIESIIFASNAGSKSPKVQRAFLHDLGSVHILTVFIKPSPSFTDNQYMGENYVNQDLDCIWVCVRADCFLSIFHCGGRRERADSVPLMAHLESTWQGSVS